MLMGGYEFVVAGQFIGMLTNVLAQHRSQKEMADRQSANLVKQQREQWRMQQENYRHQVASQMRAYDLQNSWPLDTSPVTIAKMIENGKGNMPLMLIFAPEEKSGIQKELYSVWTDLRNYFLTAFCVNSDTPVIEGGYRANWPVEPTRDYMKIYNGLKGIPVLYMASYKTQRERVMGITIAFWGRGEKKPVAQNVEIDLRKLYVDTIRDEAVQYKQLCDSEVLVWDEKCPLAKNWEVFDHEPKGVDFDYKDKKLQCYGTLKPTPETYEVMAKKIRPVLQLFSVGVVDAYFVLGYGTVPKFAELVDKLAPDDLPKELSLRNGDGALVAVSGNDFVNVLKDGYETHVLGVAEAVSLLPDIPATPFDCRIVGDQSGKIVTVSDGGNGPLLANRPSGAEGCGPFERFSLVRNGDESYSLKSLTNGKYVSVFPEKDGSPDCRLFAAAENVDLWEKFDLKSVPGKTGVYTLWSHIARKYVSVDSNQDGVLIANREKPDEWEWLRIECISSIQPKAILEMGRQVVQRIEEGVNLPTIDEVKKQFRSVGKGIAAHVGVWKAKVEKSNLFAKVLKKRS